MSRIDRLCRGLPLLLVLLLLSPHSAPAADLDDSLTVVARTNRDAATSQQRIDQIAVESQHLLEEYRRLSNNADYQVSYTRELEQLEASQQAQIESLQRQIANARVTRQRIVPLMRSMADALEKFVVLDLPFQQEQRLAAVLQLKQRLERPDIPVADRFRLLLETFQLELEYGQTLDAWRGPLSIGGEILSVEYLRIGRVALYYQSLDRQHAGYWDQAAGQWQALEGEFARPLSQALRVARKQSAPSLLQLPVRAEVAGR